MHFSVSMHHIIIRASKGIECIFFGIFYGFFGGYRQNLDVSGNKRTFAGKPLVKKN